MFARRLVRRLATGLSVVALVAFLPGAAQAKKEKYLSPASKVKPGLVMDWTETLTPVELVPEVSIEEISPLFVPLNNRYVIHILPDGVTNWSTVRNRASGYQIGLAADGWTLDSVVRNDGNTWRGGWVFGNYQGCGWILNNNIDSKTGTPSNQCPQADVFYPDQGGFARSFNCTNCNGGHAVLLSAPANRWTNVQPWLNPTGGPYINLGSRPAGYCVEWRYVTRDGRWVMAKDRSVADIDGSWAFMERSSFVADLETNSLYQQEDACPPG
jgi:hypothetical protein